MNADTIIQLACAIGIAITTAMHFLITRHHQRVIRKMLSDQRDCDDRMINSMIDFVRDTRGNSD